MNHDSEQRQVAWQNDGSVRTAEERSCVDWVEAQLSRVELLLCSPVEPGALARLLLHELAPLVGAAQGAAYVSTACEGGAQLALAAGYAAGDGLPMRVSSGEGLLGQCAAGRRKLVIRGVGADHFRVRSALGSSAPSELVFLPIALGGTTLAVLELAFTGAREPACDALLDRLVERRPSAEPAPRVEPPGSLAPPGGAASPALAASPAVAKPSLPGRQAFWSTLSHELRSPLNSVIVLSHVLAENAEHNLTEKQVKLARVIHGSGKDLLALVDNMSLLAKIEGQRLVLTAGELELSALQHQLPRVFRPLAAARGLELSIEVEPDAPRAIVTDALRVRQVLECLLAAAMDRSDVAAVRMRVGLRRSGWSSGCERLNGARGVLAFVVEASLSDDHVRDTGGDAATPPPVAHDELDMGVASPGALARGGPLGLAISHELARLLGGELTQGGGAAFTLYLPACDAESRAAPAVAACAARSASAAGASAAPAAPEPRPLELAELTGAELVLVDPDVRRAFTLTGELERQGATVTHAEDLREALERLAGRRAPSALLIDAQTLAASSEPAVQRLLRLAERTPIIVLRESGDSSASSPHFHRLSRLAGARELVALLRRVAVPDGALQTGSR